jgi:hypothetical protein
MTFEPLAELEKELAQPGTLLGINHGNASRLSLKGFCIRPWAKW